MRRDAERWGSNGLLTSLLQEARDWCTAQGLEYMETSAKEAINVGKAFESLAETVIQQLPEEGELFVL